MDERGMDGRGIAARLRGRLTYANVMSTIAVFGVLAGGGAYAATKIGPRDIRKNAVRSVHVKNGTIVGRDIKRRTRRALLRRRRGRPGPAGAAGPRGPAGERGPQGPAGSVRAYAKVDGGGEFVGAHPGFTDVRRAGTGRYCLTPVAGVDPAIAVASYAQPGSTRGVYAEAGSAFFCDADEVAVEMKDPYAGSSDARLNRDVNVIAP